MSRLTKLSLLLSVFILSVAAMQAKEPSPNERQARRIFNKTYEQVFGPQGCSLVYDVNIIGIYKTHGKIFFKEKKQRFSDERVDTGNNGILAYMAYRKKKTVEIHEAQSDKKDKYSGRFKFTLDDFTYHIADQEDGYLLTLKQKKDAKGSIKEVRALVEKKTLAPKQLRLKVAFVWTTVKISDFRSGGLSDDFFEFPREQYAKGWTFVDKRKQ